MANRHVAKKAAKDNWNTRAASLTPALDSEVAESLRYFGPIDGKEHEWFDMESPQAKMRAGEHLATLIRALTKEMGRE